MPFFSTSMELCPPSSLITYYYDHSSTVICVFIIFLSVKKKHSIMYVNIKALYIAIVRAFTFYLLQSSHTCPSYNQIPNLTVSKVVLEANVYRDFITISLLGIPISTFI